MLQRNEDIRISIETTLTTEVQASTSRRERERETLLHCQSCDAWCDKTMLLA